MLTGEQIRGARAMLRLERRELAERAGVSFETIKRLERISGPISATPGTVEAALSHQASRGRFSDLVRRAKLLESLDSTLAQGKVMTSKNMFP